jgi:hypothetical protein
VQKARNREAPDVDIGLKIWSLFHERIQVRPVGLPQSKRVCGETSPSPMRPPAQAANQEAAAPNNAAAPAVKARMTALLKIEMGIFS